MGDDASVRESEEGPRKVPVEGVVLQMRIKYLNHCLMSLGSVLLRVKKKIKSMKFTKTSNLWLIIVN